MFNKSVDQSGIRTTGDVAGGNITKTYNILPTRGSNLSEVCDRLRKSVSEDEGKAQFIESLLDFMDDKQTPQGGFKSLEEKLRLGNQESKISRANRLKERFSKKITESSFNGLLQEFYALLLTDIDSGFEHLVRPLLTSGKREEASRAIHEVFSAIEAKVAGETTLVTKEDLEGMLYYLTGKCFVNWH